MNQISVSLPCLPISMWRIFPPFFICLALLAVHKNVQAQTGPPIQWENTIGGNGDDFVRSIQQTADGGYILGGYSQSDTSGDKTENSHGSFDYWVVKLNAIGNIQWQNTIGGNKLDRLNSLQQTADGGYILGGYSSSDISGDKTENNHGGPTFGDYWVVKLDTAGNIQWQNTIGGNGEEALNSIRQTADGGYILGGDSRSNNSGDKTENCQGGFDYWVVKLDATGDIQWQNTIGGNETEVLFSLQQTSEGGYILGGISYSNISSDKTENSQGFQDYWVVKLDAIGNIQWQNTIGGNGNEELQSLQQTSDGGYILGGFSNSDISGDKTENSQGNNDYWVVKLDNSGTIQWQNTIGGNLGDYLYSIQQTADGGYILGGYSSSDISGDKTEKNKGAWDYWVVKLDASGNIQWQNDIGGNESDYFISLQQTADGGYILGGYSSSDISGDKTENNQSNDYWIVKTSPTSPVSQPNSNTFFIRAYPNPASNELYLDYSDHVHDIQRLALYDITGRKVLNLPVTVTGFDSVDVSILPTGLYVLKINGTQALRIALTR